MSPPMTADETRKKKDEPLAEAVRKAIPGILQKAAKPEIAERWVEDLAVSLWGKDINDRDWNRVHRVLCEIAEHFNIPLTIGPKP